MKLQSANERLEREISTLRRQVAQSEAKMQSQPDAFTEKGTGGVGSGARSSNERELSRIQNFLKKKAHFEDDDEYGNENDEYGNEDHQN